MDAETSEEIRKLRSQIAALEDKVEFLYRKLNMQYLDTSSQVVDPRLVSAIKKGNMIEAIKVYRSITNCGLVEAKEAVEAMWARYSN